MTISDILKNLTHTKWEVLGIVSASTLLLGSKGHHLNSTQHTRRGHNKTQYEREHNTRFRLSRVSTNSLWSCNGSPQNATVGMPFRLSLKLWNDKNDRNDTTKKSCDILWSFAISGCESCSYSQFSKCHICVHVEMKWKWMYVYMYTYEQGSP